MFSCIYIAQVPIATYQGQEQKTPWWQSFDVNRKPRSLWLLVASFKMISLNSDFILIFYPSRHDWKIVDWDVKPQHNQPTHFLIILYMYIAPGQGQTNTWGQNFDVNRKLLPLRPCVASLKKNLFEF